MLDVLESSGVFELKSKLSGQRAPGSPAGHLVHEVADAHGVLALRLRQALELAILRGLGPGPVTLFIEDGRKKCLEHHLETKKRLGQWLWYC